MNLRNQFDDKFEVYANQTAKLMSVLQIIPGIQFAIFGKLWRGNDAAYQPDNLRRLH